MAIAKASPAPAGEVSAGEEIEIEDPSLERLLEHVPSPTLARPGAAEPDVVPAFARPEVASPAPALRTARVASVDGRKVQVAYRGRGAPVEAIIDEGVDVELVKRAMLGNDVVLIEADPEVGPVIVGVVQTRLPDVAEIKARKVVIDADEELLLRAGRGAMRIREDGDVELVGSRISTLSRGLFRIVGRVLRLN